MHDFTVQETINAPVTHVWKALADIGNIYQWNPGVKKSHTTNDTNGLGGSRHCNLGGKNYLEEDVVKWEENRYLSMRITETNLPFKTADINFTLEEKDDGTNVSINPVYELKFGPVGRFMNLVYVRGFYEKGMKSLLAGLKKHVESQT
ncbi:MAG: SRPBCC family protein [Cyclobacteriaceae bacterium]